MVEFIILQRLEIVKNYENNTFFFLTTCISLSINAQASLYLGDNNSATTEIYVNSQDGSNPTLLLMVT